MILGNIQISELFDSKIIEVCRSTVLVGMSIHRFINLRYGITRRPISASLRVYSVSD